MTFILLIKRIFNFQKKYYFALCIGIEHQFLNYAYINFLYKEDRKSVKISNVYFKNYFVLCIMLRIVCKTIYFYLIKIIYK